MTLMNKLLSAASILALAASLACGGGGGSTPPPPPPPVAPTIGTQPANQSVLAGATATFSVTAAGTAPLSYQWKKDGAAITGGATLATYTTLATAVVDSGSSFTVTVSNSAGSVTSSAAVLTVQPVATSLSYTDPASAPLQLKKNIALSTPTHLVLDLVGDATMGTGSGITATFSTDATKVTWANVAAGDPAAFLQNGTAFTLGAAPQILKGKVTGNVLQVVAAQKGNGSPVSLNGTLLRIALDLKASQPTGAVTLLSDGNKCQVMDGTSGSIIAGFTISIGTLTAQ